MKLPNFSFEKRLWKKGHQIIAGADEVGRGSFAGPVVAASVAFSPKIQNTKYKIPVKIDDSKKLTPLQRQKAAKWIKKNSLVFTTGSVSAKLIDKLGMTKASQMAFRRAVINVNKKLEPPISYLLIDAFYVPYVKGLPRSTHQKAIKNGDSRSISIAAASIIAKVYRDGLMVRLSEKTSYKKYHWESNKGYGTKAHRLAIKKYGVSRFHRKSFMKTH